MSYYKIIKDGTLVGTATSTDLRKVQSKHGVLVACDADQAELICCNEALYKAKWMKPGGMQMPFFVADVVVIGEEEYTLLQSGEEIQPANEELEQPAEEPETIEPEKEITADYLRKRKLASLAVDCSNAITDGVDVKLSGNVWIHMSLTQEDQVNLQRAKLNVIAGNDDFVPLHVDGRQDQYYAMTDVLAISDAADRHIQYHQSYYNGLKTWLQDVTDLETISSVEYGTPVPYKYQSDVLKTLLLEAKK